MKTMNSQDVATRMSVADKRRLLRGKREERDGDPIPFDTGWWLLGTILLVLLVTMVISVSAHAETIHDRSTIDYVQRSLDKTVIITRDGAQTLSAPRGSGTRYITIIKQRRSDDGYHASHRDSHRDSRHDHTSHRTSQK